MTTEEVIQRFLKEVRSGLNPDAALELMAPQVLAHQLVSEAPATVSRTPENYASHVREMQATYGHFTLHINELIVQDDRAYVRWTQRGQHLGEIDGISPSGREITEIASAVYRVQEGRITEYWIQVDREGIRLQLER